MFGTSIKDYNNQIKFIQSQMTTCRPGTFEHDVLKSHLVNLQTSLAVLQSENA